MAQIYSATPIGGRKVLPNNGARYSHKKKKQQQMKLTQVSLKGASTPNKIQDKAYTTGSKLFNTQDAVSTHPGSHQMHLNSESAANYEPDLTVQSSVRMF